MSELTRRGFLFASAGVGVAALTPLPALAAEKTTIATDYMAQVTQNWCSAASTRIALTAAGKHPGQGTLASELGLGPSGGAGLQNPEAIANVLNARLGYGSGGFRYLLRQDMAALDDALAYGVTIDKPVVYNVNQVAGQSYTASGHYIVLTGRRKVGTNSVEYRISDPDSPARTGNWYPRGDVKSWVRFDRYTAFGFR